MNTYWKGFTAVGLKKYANDQTRNVEGTFNDNSDRTKAAVADKKATAHVAAATVHEAAAKKAGKGTQTGAAHAAAAAAHTEAARVNSMAADSIRAKGSTNSKIAIGNAAGLSSEAATYSSTANGM